MLCVQRPALVPKQSTPLQHDNKGAGNPQPENISQCLQAAPTLLQPHQGLAQLMDHCLVRPDPHTSPAKQGRANVIAGGK